MASHVAAVALVEALLFVLTMALVLGSRTKALGEYFGIAFHLVLLLLIVELPCGLPSQAAGCLWVVCDVIASVGSLWNRQNAGRLQTGVFTPIRMAGHLFASVWIIGVSLRLNTSGLIVGIVLAAGFAIYTLAAGRLPEKALFVPGLFMVLWLVLLARHLT